MKKLSGVQKCVWAGCVITSLLSGSLIAGKVQESSAYVRLRRAIPVGQNLAEAEQLYAVTDVATKSQVRNVSASAGSLVSTNSTSSLQELLASHVTDLAALRSSYELEKNQLSVYETLIQDEAAKAKAVIEQIRSTSHRIEEENKVVRLEIEGQQKLKAAKQNLALVESVLEQSRDIELLYKSLQHQIAMGRANDSLSGLYDDVAREASVIQQTSDSIMAAML
ncbi:MAG: hypothetical protein JNL58_31700 [Planctomyces sp.]|nr:hypothetical protein [Planctomyces sp.]